MHYHVDDTIVAIASAAGGAPRGIIRLSGPQVRDIAASVFRTAAGSALPQTHAAVLTGDVHLTDLESRDCKFQRRLPAELYFWPTAQSYTRQPSAEFHTLGSPPLLHAAMRELMRAGARPAKPGEFTLRAFLAGRIDLTQAEAVLGVIDALDAPSLQTALTQLAGGLARPLAGLRDRLLDLLARLEAGLDFVDEDIEFIDAEEILAEVEIARSAVAALQAQLAARGRLDRPPRVVLIGPPNAGKSSLFNALIGGQALVGDEPGTTRDYLRGQLDLPGVCCELIDTAGVLPPAASDPVARDAQSQSADQLRQADVRLYCQDATSAYVTAADDLRQQEGLPALWLLTKIDRLNDLDKAKFQLQLPHGPSANPPILTSARTGAGLDVLRTRLRKLLDQQSPQAGRSVGATAARAEQSLLRAHEALSDAAALTARRAGDELIAAALRLALSDLGQVSGAVATEDLLDRIFSRFCIGK